jgi:putative transposase
VTASKRPGRDLFSTLKVERVYRTSKEAELDLFRYIDGWYNPHRIQRELGWLSPNEYEEAYYLGKTPRACFSDRRGAGRVWRAAR